MAEMDKHLIQCLEGKNGLRSARPSARGNRESKHY